MPLCTIITLITPLSAQELAAEYELKEMETESDCVARIAAVERSCTIKVCQQGASSTEALRGSDGRDLQYCHD